MPRSLLALAALAGAVKAASLEDVCTAKYVSANLPANDTLLALLSARVCDVNFAYTHDGVDRTNVNYWMPSPANFLNRYVSTGGPGWNITEKNSSLPSGVELGAVAGTTDGGFGGITIKEADHPPQ
ncbi:hypothetical protein BO71DRAFT_439355 [Aspergillus ellipticus CBS 707.79]|uniref:Carboxylic ester hydrolase n=1 Tax=Aspergillus ellipticus CBS 707.79 TaxID=1448320 RepID=A0A319DRJ5_9EURO|nr:hypothetical protein BO71DRAFT_439355 [Aspergillus ellipticus CBS 707.79]